MKKWWLVLLALFTMMTVMMGGTVQASKVPRTPKTINLSGKYGHYRRYTKKLPKSIRGKWYAKINKRHRYYDELNFKTYRSIIEKRQTNAISFDMYNRISKAPYGEKLFYNGHWFAFESLAFGGVCRVKKMTIEHRRQAVLMRYEQGQTTYYLRHKSNHMHQFNHAPADVKLMGN
ncbi:hypothetical protein [Lactiplantibacillus carotarum]|uniref:hypothetical protein n=1 Tax=Lactiplantibacillus carotarum TaxID=2993456 RepID=UPI00298F0238|nr:hypothetical protein [Lactiplantibacillus carotarum]